MTSPVDFTEALRQAGIDPTRRNGSSPKVESTGTWEPRDITGTVDGLLDGTLSGPQPELLRRVDGRCLLYRGMINGLWGASDAAKSWIALQACIELLHEGEEVWYLDFEDTERGILSRLVLDLRIDPDLVKWGFKYIQPEGPPSAAEFSKLCRRSAGAGLIVVDSIGEWLGLTGADSYKDEVVAGWIRTYLAPLTTEGCSALVLDHLPHDNDDLRRPIGSQRKKAAVNGAAYMVRSAVPMGRGSRGVSQLITAKDRHGHWVSGHAAADYVLDSTGPMSVASLIQPGEVVTTNDERNVRSRALRELLVESGDEGVTAEDARQRVHGTPEDEGDRDRQNQAIRRALNNLVRDGGAERVDEGRRGHAVRWRATEVTRLVVNPPPFEGSL